MAQEKYAYGGNTGDLFADDDPLAELARIVGYEQPVPRSAAPAQRAEPAFSPQPVRVVSGGRAEPAFDLEDELLKEFERYDAPGLDPSASIGVEPMRDAAPSSFRPAVEERVAPVPVAAPALDNWASLSPEPAPRHEPDSFAVDLADELELAVSAADEPVAAPRAGLNLPLSSYRISREEPSFEAVPEPVFVEQAEPAYDVSHFATASARAVQPQIDFSFVPEPVAAPVVEPVRVAPAAAPVRKEPELDAPDNAIATDEFELALDGLELDLSDIVLSEVASATPVSKGAQQALAAPAPEFVWEEPVPAVADLPDEAMPFDASLIAEPDYAPEVIGEMDVPDMPVHETAAPAAYQPAFDTDFDAEIADLFHDERAVASAAAAASEAAPVRKPAVDLDDFSFMMNEDFNSVASAQVAAESGKGRIVIDPDKMEYADVEGETRRFGWKAAALASVAVLVSATGLYAWFSSGGVSRLNSADGPPIVVADSEPVKIVPENPGGKTVPNQDKAVYDRVAGGAPQTPTQKSLISSSEEPMDVVQRTLTPENFPTVRAEDEDMLVEEADERLQPGVGSETAATDNPAADANVSLRKVRTMIVRPDGSLVAREVPESAPAAPQQQTAARLPAAAPAQPAAPEVSTEALSQAAASTVTETAARTARPAGNDRAPLPAQRPAEQPVNIVGAVTNEGNIRQAPAQPPQQQQAAVTPAAPSQTAPASAAIPPGTYVVQIASLPSQAEAEKSYRSMSAKYGGIIGGKGVDIKAADIPGKGTYYRVRVVAGAKADADALCGKLKAAGGSCLVTR